METRTPSLKRTLILTGGPLSEQCGQRWQQVWSARQGPAIGCAWLPVEEGEDMVVWQAQLAQTIRQMSPASLPAQLLAAGWHLDNGPDLDLILLLDVRPELADWPLLLVDQVQTAVYRELGLETAVLLLCVAGETTGEADESRSATVDLPLPPNRNCFGRGVWLLGLLNEAGLRLPETDDLVAITAELLWGLTATPLRHLPESIDTGAVVSVGLSGWSWSLDDTAVAFAHQWQKAVLTHWLAASDTTATAVTAAAVWLEQEAWTARGLSPAALPEEEARLPPFAPKVWQAPRPWQFRRHLLDLHLLDAADAEAQPQRCEWACFRLDEPICERHGRLLDYLEQMLNQKPCGGIDHAHRWLEALFQGLEQQYRALSQQEANRSGRDAELAQQRGLLEAELKPLLAQWPDPTWRGWLRQLIWPWRWPHLLWSYWQIRQRGQRLLPLLRQQAMRRREQAAAAAVGQALLELVRLARRVQSQVEEIGDMLRAVRRQLPDPDLVEMLSRPTSPFSILPASWGLYGQIISDETAEAAAAAEAVGGLGRHLRHLDDTVIDQGLAAFAQKRLQPLAAETAVTVWAALVNRTETASDGWWQALWSLATPLWPYDEARLPEAARSQAGHGSYLCADVSPDQQPRLPWEEQEPTTWLPLADRERAYLLRLRWGQPTAIDHSTIWPLNH